MTTRSPPPPIRCGGVFVPDVRSATARTRTDYAGSPDGTKALPARERLRPDVELQRLGSRDERDVGHPRLQRAGRGSLQAEPRAVRRRADLSDPARPGVPP